MTVTQTKLIRFGHSPDPDDAFMFYAFAKEAIPMRGFKVEHVIEDIQTLNQRALQAGEFKNVAPLEVTAVSCHAYAYLADRYAIMRSGASVGDKYGPILVARKGTGLKSSGDLAGKRIAIPGKLTTAFLAMQLYQKNFTPIFTPFDQILDVVLRGEVDYGLVIHEGQITYSDKGLEKVLDLGEWWHEKTKLPLPLGVDVIRKDLGKDCMESFARLFKESIQYALDHRQEALAYALQYGRGISEDLNDRFVGMYVNDRTVELGPSGQAGFQKLLDWGVESGLVPHRIQLEFVG